MLHPTDPDHRPVSVIVADKLTDHVLGQLAPGMSLPSEAELAERYGVSRVTMREAVKMLAGRGLLDVGRGRRAIVRQPDGSVFGDFLSSLIKSDPKCLFDLIEVRRSLEIQSVTMAAQRATRAGITAAESALERMTVAPGLKSAFTRLMPNFMRRWRWPAATACCPICSRAWRCRCAKASMPAAGGVRCAGSRSMTW
jgi:DNA-binding FadR family transcriptional regulator